VKVVGSTGTVVEACPVFDVGTCPVEVGCSTAGAEACSDRVDRA
jgi:hypothetical protein